MGRIGAILGVLGRSLGVSEPSWAVLGRFWRPLGLSWSVGKPKRRDNQNPYKTIVTSTILAFRGPLGGPLGGLLGSLGPSWRRIGGLLGELGGIVDPLGPSWRPSWTILGGIGGHIGQSWMPYWANVAILEAILSRLGGTFGNWAMAWASYGSWGGDGGLGRSPRGSSFGKEPKPKPRGSSTPGTPVMNQQGAADLMAFGPSRHRAWVVGQRPLGCSLGSRGRHLGGLLEAVLETLGGLGPLGAS